LEFGEDGSGEVSGLGLELLPFQALEGSVEAGGGHRGDPDEEGDGQEDLQKNGTGPGMGAAECHGL
jgi:hypothetical protein